MSKSLNPWLLAIIASHLYLVPPAVAAPGGSNPLVNVDWLDKSLKGGDLLVIDASPAKLHAAGHIPGAVNVDVFTFGGRQIPAPEMEKLIQSWGVSPGERIGLYDQGGTYFATSLLFE